MIKNLTILLSKKYIISLIIIFIIYKIKSDNRFGINSINKCM